MVSPKWSHNCFLGISDGESVKLDFDDAPFKKVKSWAQRTMRWFRLGGFIVLKSSENHYHTVFNRTVSWGKNVAIMAWVCFITKHQKLTGWFILQCIKKGSTLRVSPKGDKPSPRIVYSCGKQDQEIQDFLAYRKLIKNIIKKIHT